MFQSTAASLLAIVLLQSSVLAQSSALATTANSIQLCCASLSLAIGSSKVFSPSTAGYNASATSYFAQQEGELAPYCYVKPSSSQDVSTIVKTLALLNFGHYSSPVCPFAVRGGGHHTVVGIANIHNGITIDLGNINQTTLNSDKSVASVGSGARWGSVYATLVPQGLAVLGGRESDIGVGGFTTGGGISYFGATYGFGCDMVSNFEIVLADGSIKNANAQQNPALFTALKGGSNNFGIVTRFDMKTFALGQYFGGSDYYLGAETPQLIDAFAAFTANPKFDIKAAAFLSILYTAQEGFISLVTFSYTEAISNPPVFANFTAVPPILSTTGISTLDVFAEELGGANTPDNLRQTSITATVKPDTSLLQQIYVLWNETMPQIFSAQNLVVSLTMQPLAGNFLKAGALNGGNVLGLDASESPLAVLTLTIQYTDKGSDALIASTSRALFQKIEALAAKSGDLNPWFYLNYADVTQNVIGSYGAANVQKLKAASVSYDPFGFFQTVQPGGFKVRP